MASIVSGDIIIDVVQVYRLWVVWNRKCYIILLPALSVVGVAVAGSGITYELANYEKGKDIFSSTAQTWVICEAVFTVLSNRMADLDDKPTLFRLQEQACVWVEPFNSCNSRLHRKRLALQEHSSFLVVFIATYIAKHRIESLIADCLPPVAGISFGLINLRCHLSRAKAASQEATAPVGPIIDLSRFGGLTVDEGEGEGGDDDLAYPMQPLAIHIVPDVHPSPEVSTDSQLERPKSADAQRRQASNLH
ncbi:hypothetical protein PQX77_003749 [Marasmius sp. AFHP31]|nr:hypothetical protein PQX77_003749 [Marasmius sp. AFHP31]